MIRLDYYKTFKNIVIGILDDVFKIRITPFDYSFIYDEVIYNYFITGFNETKTAAKIASIIDR